MTTDTAANMSHRRVKDIAYDDEDIYDEDDYDEGEEGLAAHHIQTLVGLC